MNESLKDHPIFKMMDLEDENSKGLRASQLITMKNSLLFAWNNKKSCLLVANTSHKKTPSVQTLLCHDPPLFEVRRIICMNDSSHVVMIGSRGVSVMVLPRRFLHASIKDEKKDKVVCRTITVAERFFTTNISVQLLQASWHPISDCSKPFLFVLSSDNTLRLFNIASNPQCATHTYSLAQNAENVISHANINGSLNSIFSMYSTVTSLGETAVAFDYGQEIEWTPNKTNMMMDESTNTSTVDTLSLLQIYILKGNGDVLLLLSNLYDQKYSKGILFGPLIMLPQADDNYGTDSCSILVTKTTPSMIVIGTKSSGKVHHCIALNQTDDADDLPIKRLGLSETTSNGRGGHTDVGELEPTLYVYETVQLEIVPLDDDDDEEYFVDLSPDPSLPWRYYCCTCVGVHSISLPWLQQLSHYLLSSEDDDKNKNHLSMLAHDDPCVVEHMICTKPTSTSHPCLVRGLTISRDVGPTTLLCVTADSHCTTIPLLSTLRGTSAELFMDEKTPSSAADDLVCDPTTSDNKLSEQDFEKYIKNLLHRDASQPILRSGSSGGGDQCNEITQQEASQMVIRATTILREEYIFKQTAAKQAIIKRTQLINDQKATQKDDIRTLRRLQEELTDNAGKIANDYEDMKENQEMLMMRISNIIKSSKLDDPVLSRAELSMGKELRKISDQLRRLDNSIKQIKIKHSYQEKQMKNSCDEKEDRRRNMNEMRSKNVSEMTRSALHTNQLKQILLEEGDKIHELIKKLNNMNVQVGL